MERINRDALFCDETEEYRNPCEADEGDRIELLFRTERTDADAVYYINLEDEHDGEHRLSYIFCDKLFSYYRTVITAGKAPINYFFRIEKNGDVCYYNRLGVVESSPEDYPFRITPGFHVPKWIEGAVIYQIYIDRFCNGDPSNDVVSNEYVYIGKPVERVTDWQENPSDMDVRRFYGGDLQGIWDKLDYLKSLKVEAIYLNPVFVSPSNHKYDCQDYDHIDPHFAVIKNDTDLLVEPNAIDNYNADKYTTRVADEENLEASDAFFAKFIEAAHQKGIRIIMDGVFNHCGSFNKWLDAELLYQHEGDYPLGAYVSADSPYRNFFKFNHEDAWPFNETYNGWWGHSTLPKLNYEDSKELYDYILNVARKWVSPPYNADGWRLDVAADLGRTPEFNHQFWRDFRKAVKGANPDAVILAEHYGDPSSWLEGDQWDTVMNYDAFMEPVSWLLTGLEKHSLEANEALHGNGTAFFNAMNYHMSRMQTQSLYAAMNELSNHDHSRFMTRTNRRTGRLSDLGAEAAGEGISHGIFRQGVMINMTWPGAPTIYYGDETGMCGWTDPDNRRTFPWGQEDQELIEFHRYMTGIRNRNQALRRGSLKQLLAEQGLISYGRFYKDNKCVIAVNTDEEKRTTWIPVWRIGVTDAEELSRCMLTYEDGYNAGCVNYPVKDGVLEVELPARGAILLVAVKKEKNT
ncbi:MAG: glycoside hydrolase family 13 protein [Clostridium sp.]